MNYFFWVFFVLLEKNTLKYGVSVTVQVQQFWQQQRQLPKHQYQHDWKLERIKNVVKIMSVSTPISTDPGRSISCEKCGKLFKPAGIVIHKRTCVIGIHTCVTCGHTFNVNLKTFTDHQKNCNEIVDEVIIWCYWTNCFRISNNISWATLVFLHCQSSIADFWTIPAYTRGIVVTQLPNI